MISSIEAEAIDGEPDQFFFTFAGRSGQFVIGPTSTSTTIKDYRAVPHQRLRIVPTFSGGGITAFSIQTEDGTRYTFGAIETNTDNNATSQSTERLKLVLWLMLNSPEYSIQK